MKDDLDILRRYREEFADNVEVSTSVSNDMRYKALRDKVQRRMYRAYVLRQMDKSDILTGVANMAIAVVALSLPAWVLPVNVPLILRAGIASIFVVIGVFFIYIGFKDRKQPHNFSETHEIKEHIVNSKESGSE